MKTLVYVVTFLFAGVTFDVAQVLGLVFLLLDYLSGINPDSLTISLLASVTFFGVLKLISDRRGMGLSFFLIRGRFVAMLLFSILFDLFGRRTVDFRAFGIDLPDVKGGLQVGFCLCIICFFYHFFPRV